jgi:outer membrane lipoprotein-sorting protein
MVSLRPNLAGWFVALTMLAPAGFSATAEDASGELLDKWFAAQSELKTWSADLVQVRKLKALKEPLSTEGRVWFSSPKHFRWEIGDPAQTVAVREESALVVLYPRLKRAERYPLDDDSTGQWRDALTLLESGFPQSRMAMEEQFKITDVSLDGDLAEFSMIPKSASTRKLLKEVRISFNIGDMMLRSTELRFADESSMRNEFRNGRANPQLDTGLFEATIPDHFKTSEPLSKIKQ